MGWMKATEVLKRGRHTKPGLSIRFTESRGRKEAVITQAAVELLEGKVDWFVNREDGQAGIASSEEAKSHKVRRGANAKSGRICCAPVTKVFPLVIGNEYALTLSTDGMLWFDTQCPL